ncbi:FlgD immunoglobulin-like domain containing protein [Bacteroidota bacterium]
MKRKFTIALLVICLPIICFGQSLLNAPQKIVIDKKPGRIGFTRNRLLVSNYANGDIVEIDSAGNQSYFKRNANFVDGLEVVGDVVYGIGNNRMVLGYNLDTKRQVMSVRIDGVMNDYLSSIISDSSGHLFISCPNLNEIYRLRISDRSYWVFVKDKGLNRPNGILLEKEKDRIVVIDDCLSPSLIHAISLTDSTVSVLASTNFNNPDGITRDKYGYHYIGGYYLPGMYRTDADFSYYPQLFFTGNNIVYPTYDPDDHSLLITYYENNSWERVALSTTANIKNIPQKEPVIYKLFPNPFNSFLSIHFELKNRIHVRLDAYNSEGLLITTLVNKEIDSGSHSVLWNGNDNTGKLVANGIYYISLIMDGVKHTQKAILTN